MKKLLTGYSMYFNKKHTRTGQLFEGTFKATHVDNDTYLKYLFAYIHLNPVKISDPSGWKNKTIRQPETARKFLTNYEYSSYPYYSGRTRPSDSIINNPKAFPDYFQTRRDFDEFIKDWVDFSGE